MKIVGMGTGNTGSLTLAALDAAQTAGTFYLQTGDVQAAEYLRGMGFIFKTLDDLFEQSGDYDELAELAAQRIWQDESATLFVLGSIAGSSIAAAVIEAAQGRPVEIIPGPDFASCAEDMFIKGAEASQRFTARGFADADFSTELPLVITDIDNPYIASDVIDALLRWYPDDIGVGFVKGGLCEETTLRGLMRRDDWSYETRIVLPALGLREKCAYSFEDLRRVMKILRAPGGCPWDREQTHETLRPYLLEESYEVMDAVDKGDMAALEDELGDVLLQVVFHACIGEEHSEFDAHDITTDICKKMISRHSHIFGDDKCDTADAVVANWEKLKRKEKGLTTYTQAMLDVPKSLSSMTRAAKLQKKAALVGFDWPDHTGAMDKLREETDELSQAAADGTNIEEEAGDLLFAAVNALRLLKIAPDVALNAASRKFIERFEKIENAARAKGKDLADMPLEEQDALWNEVKRSEKRKNV